MGSVGEDVPLVLLEASVWGDTQEGATLSEVKRRGDRWGKNPLGVGMRRENSIWDIN